MSSRRRVPLWRPAVRPRRARSIRLPHWGSSRGCLSGRRFLRCSTRTTWSSGLRLRCPRCNREERIGFRRCRFDIGSKTWYTLIRRAVKESFLDKEVISSYLVPRLRDLKANQQLITVTSNPDMVILGDSENVIVTKPGKQLKIVENGDIYKESIRTNVLDILEGGEESVIRRGGKLNVFEA